MSLCVVRSSVNIDETFQVPHIVRPGETISSSAMWTRPGGKGANVAAVLGLAGVRVRMLGAVGEDAKWPIRCLDERHVDTSCMYVSPDVPTGRAFIQLSQGDGENSIVLLKGANFALDTPLDDVQRWLSPEVTHLILQNEIPLASTIAYVQHAPTLADVPCLAPIPWLVVTRGSQGSRAGVILDGERTWIDVPASRTTHVVNTTGAGDTYTGYLVAGLMTTDHWTIDRVRAVLQRASVAAAMAVEVDGAMESIPAASEVEARCLSL